MVQALTLAPAAIKALRDLFEMTRDQDARIEPPPIEEARRVLQAWDRLSAQAAMDRANAQACNIRQADLKEALGIAFSELRRRIARDAPGDCDADLWALHRDPMPSLLAALTAADEEAAR